MRGWLMVKKSRQPFEEVVVGLDRPDTAENIRKYSPSGRVPVLLSGNLTVWDSLAIGEYLAETYPAANLWPKDAEARAVARSISAEMRSKSTRLNSSHANISYAVFCLKKKK